MIKTTLPKESGSVTKTNFTFFFKIAKILSLMLAAVERLVSQEFNVLSGSTPLHQTKSKPRVILFAITHPFVIFVVNYTFMSVRNNTFRRNAFMSEC